MAVGREGVGVGEWVGVGEGVVVGEWAECRLIFIILHLLCFIS